MDVPDDARVWTEETFGPLLPIRRVSSLDEAIELANLAGVVGKVAERQSHELSGLHADARKRLEHFISAHPKHMLVGGARFSLYQLRIDAGEGAQVAQELQAQIGKPDTPLPSDTMLILLAHAYDAQGKATDLRVCDLLGGAVRESVPFSAYLFYRWAQHPDHSVPDD